MAGGSPVTHVAFLRSINVGGRRVKNDALVSAVAAVGTATAYQAAGNLVFSSAITEDAVSDALSEALGFEVPVFVRTVDEVARLAAADPFPGVSGKLQVTLTRADPPDLSDLSTSLDRLATGDRAWFWLPANGISGSELDVRAIEARAGVGTTRTQRTLVRIAKKFG